jgi:plasmid stabilization system protein ParE
LTRIRWTPLALADLKNISGYIEGQRNLATANRVCRIIDPKRTARLLTIMLADEY